MNFKVIKPNKKLLQFTKDNFPVGSYFYDTEQFYGKVLAWYGKECKVLCLQSLTVLEFESDDTEMYLPFLSDAITFLIDLSNET